MWKWLKQLVRSLFGIKYIAPQLPPGDNGIEVTSIPNDIDLTDEQKSFQKHIHRVHKDEGLTDEEIEKAIEELLTVYIPKEYKRALRIQKKDIIITQNHTIFWGKDGNSSGNYTKIAKLFPVLKDKLAQLGIRKVSHPIPSAIFIDTNSITKAAEKWGDDNGFKIKINNTDF